MTYSYCYQDPRTTQKSVQSTEKTKSENREVEKTNADVTITGTWVITYGY